MSQKATTSSGLDALAAALRRLYLHAANGGTVKAADLGRLVERVERLQVLAAQELAASAGQVDR